MFALSPYPQELLDASMQSMDGLYNDEVGLLRQPPDIVVKHAAYSGPAHMVRDSTWYALGLFMRDGLGDRQRAERILDVVLDHQLIEPEAPFHGTWLRYPEEPRPGGWSREWRDYDPNWRDFIGTTLALILIHFEHELSFSLIDRINNALRLAVEGTLARKVNPAYTNIALMDAYLLHFAGIRLGEKAWIAEGETLGSQVFGLFQRNEAFEEYNSPTYYGTDLYALELWRTRSESPLLRDMGEEMEVALWKDIARYYHPDLKNVAGPWDRSYGVDMQRYAALLGMWIWLLVGRERAPFPDTTQPFGHSADLCFGPCVAILGTEPPPEVLPYFERFQGPHHVEHTITTSPLRVATAWLDEKYMLGAEYTSLSRQGNYQFHPLTIHWQPGGGPVHWARMTHAQPVDVRAAKGELIVEGQGAVTFEIYAPGTQVEALQGDLWRLHGLTITVESNRQAFQAECTAEDTFKLHYAAEDDEEINFRLLIQ